MKKLITSVAIACAAAMVNAATYSWSGESCWVSPDGENPLAAAVYLYDANVWGVGDITSALAKNDTSVFGKAIASTAVDGDGAFYSEGTGLTDNGGEPPYASMYAILVAQDDSGNDFFYNAGTLDVEITSAVVSGKAKFAFGGEEGITTGAVGSSGWTAMAIPEPTSGLLLLLGVAGLALKRKCA